MNKKQYRKMENEYGLTLANHRGGSTTESLQLALELLDQQIQYGSRRNVSAVQIYAFREACRKEISILLQDQCPEIYI